MVMLRFEFGRNWMRFLESVDEEKVERAKRSLLRYLPEKEWKGKVFVDVGSGSGLFSLSAVLLGVRKVFSFDVDEDSVRATEMMKEKFSYLWKKVNPEVEWEVFRGDILSSELVEKLRRKGEIVYAWGVLHHTGDMWQAIRNTCEIVKDKGYLILAIYNRAPFSPLWKFVKAFYNSLPSIGKLIFIITTLGMRAVELNHFIRLLRKYKNEKRGMNFLTDHIDWIGGYPYEYACADEVVKFVEGFGFELVKKVQEIPCVSLKEYVKPNLKKILTLKYLRWSFFSTYTGNNEFVFRRK